MPPEHFSPQVRSRHETNSTFWGLVAENWTQDERRKLKAFADGWCEELGLPQLRPEDLGY